MRFGALGIHQKEPSLGQIVFFIVKRHLTFYPWSPSATQNVGRPMSGKILPALGLELLALTWRNGDPFPALFLQHPGKVDELPCVIGNMSQ